MGRCSATRIGKTGQLSGKPLLHGDVWRMVRRRSADAGIETALGCHTFRATGITDYLTNGGRIEVAQRIAGYSNAKTTASTTGATTTSASAKSRGSGFEN
jgi:site-specific recombinase XerD